MTTTGFLSVARAATGRTASERPADAFLLALLRKTREGSAGAAETPPRLAAADEEVDEESAERESMVAEAILSGGSEVEGGKAMGDSKGEQREEVESDVSSFFRPLNFRSRAPSILSPPPPPCSLSL